MSVHPENDIAGPESRPIRRTVLHDLGQDRSPAGAGLFVAGSSVFGTEDPAAAYRAVVDALPA